MEFFITKPNKKRAGIGIEISNAQSWELNRRSRVPAEGDIISDFQCAGRKFNPSWGTFHEKFDS